MSTDRLTPKMSDLVGADLAEFSLPRETRIEQSLAQPEAAGAIALGKINSISKARIRHQCARLLALELPNIQKALAVLLVENPKVYLDQVYAFAEFSLPKLKSVEIDVSANSESARTLSLEELTNALNSTDVVSVQ